jgi:D-alanyl-D-alanine carboxypeptidase (penicillin-binding protein 5/6)
MLPAPPPAPTVGDETRPTGVGLAGLAAGPIPASRADRHHEGSGPGWITWLALGATVLAGLLTAAGHRRKRVRARRHAQRARARHLAAARPLPPQRPGTGPRGRRRPRDLSGSGHRGR